MGVVWHGVRELEAALRKIDQNVSAAAVHAGGTAGKELARLAAGEAPRVSGTLAGSIVSIDGGGITRVGPTVVYGRRIELGFKGRRSARGARKRRAAGIDTGGRGLQPTAANPFLTRALDGSRSHINDIYTKEWARAIISR